jgi:pimeloyl-ACP methyl ester carboxylesterase
VIKRDFTVMSEGVELYARLTPAAASAVGTVLLLSGVGFHSFEYEGLEDRLAAAGFACVAFDYRGHGRSGGARGKWRLGDLVRDTQAVLDAVRGEITGLTAVFGNSLGGMVSMSAAVDDPRIAAVAVSNCPARIADFLMTPARRLLLGLAEAVAPILPFRISVNNFYSYEQLIDDPIWVQRIRADELITDARRLSIKAFQSLIEDWDGEAMARRLRTPLLVLQGDRDALQPASQSDLIYAAAHEPKRLIRLDTGHLPNLEKPDLLAKSLTDWLGVTVSAGRAPGLARQ